MPKNIASILEIIFKYSFSRFSFFKVSYINAYHAPLYKAMDIPTKNEAMIKKENVKDNEIITIPVKKITKAMNKVNFLPYKSAKAPLGTSKINAVRSAPIITKLI